METLTLTSPDFADMGDIPERFTCQGEGTRPTLRVEGVPSQAQALAIIMHDPDAVHGDFVHWTAWNLLPAEGDIPASITAVGGLEGENSTGRQGWVAPCPPSGTGRHRYIFNVYALDEELELSLNTDRERLEVAMEGHVLAMASITGLFGN